MANPDPLVATHRVEPNSAVFFTLPAEQIMAMRGIDQAEVLKAISVGRSRIGVRSGYMIFRDGDLQIAAEREGEGLKVLTVFRDRDFEDVGG